MFLKTINNRLKKLSQLRKYPTWHLTKLSTSLKKKLAMDTPQGHFAQIVTFNTAGGLPTELFQHAWLPLGNSFYARGITNIIISERVNVAGEFNPYKCVSKHWWDSKKALELIFPNGVPVPATRGHITVSNAGVFEAVSWTGDITTHKLLDKKRNPNLFKLLFMLPTNETDTDSSSFTVESLKVFISTLVGFESLCVFKLDSVSGDPSNVWLCKWVIEAIFNYQTVTPHNLIDEIRNSEKLPKTWRAFAFADKVQITPRDV